MLDKSSTNLAKRELHDLIEVLSEYECAHLLRAFRGVSAGDRFWEDDVGILYNEYVKARFFNIGRNTSNVVAAGPVTDDGPFAPVSIIKSYGDAERVVLPQPQRLNAAFSDVVLNRRSLRDFTGAPLSLEQFSTLMHHGCGTTGIVSGYGYRRLPLRTFPSAGGLQSSEVYVSVQAVGGLSPAMYHYHPLDHAIEVLEPGNHGDQLRNLALGQSFVHTAGVVILITGYYERLRWKYGERAYRYMCMDAGFVAENLHLAGMALGLGVCSVAGFADDAIESLLDIDGRSEAILLLMGVGSISNDRKDSPT